MIRIKAVKGFTLVEVIIVMFIIAVLSSIAVSSFNKYAKNVDFKNAVRRIAADLAYLKQRAVAEGIHYKIVLSAEDNSYKIMKGGFNGASSEYDEAGAVIKRLSSFCSDMVFSAGSPPNYPGSQIVFQPRGTTSAGSVFLENGNGSKAKITSSLMGRVRVRFD